MRNPQQPPQPDVPPVARPMRWAQLTLVENDPGRFDPNFWIDYFQRTHVEGVCLSAGGCVAYYPTQVLFHHRSRFLADSDPFGDLVAACRQLGLVVVARTDPHACHNDAFQAHPEWVAVDADGNPRRHWARPDEYWVTCALGPYNFEFMTEVTAEIVRLYAVDGVFCNRWAGHGVCHCDHCRTAFRDAAGMDLPRTRDHRDPARQAYLSWREDRLFDLWRLWEGEIRAINPAARFIPNTGGGALADLDMVRTARMASILVADRQARAGLTAPWAAGKNAREYRGALGNTPIIGLFSVGLETEHRWKDSVQSPREVRIWAADGVAHGFRPWYCKFSGVLHDRRWLAPVEEFFAWHHRCERYLRNERNLARVAVVYSQQTARFYGGEHARRKVEDHILGVCQALVEARVPFEMLHDGLLDPDHTAPFRLLVLPNVAALSDRQCDQLRAHVAAGCALLATHETSLYDERGCPRDDFGLADVFGASFRGGVDGPMKNAYLRLHHPHPVLAGLEDAPRIIHGVHRVRAELAAELPAAPVTLVPPYPDLPMEEVYPRVEDSGVPELYLRETGAGRVAYFNWDVDRTFREVLAEDHLKLLANTVRWALNEDPPVEVIGGGVLDVAVWRQRDSVTVHLVNLTNPMMMKGPYREFLPCPAQRVRVRLPDGARPERVHLLVADTDADWRADGAYVEADVPAVTSHEVLAIDLAWDGNGHGNGRSADDADTRR